MSGGQEAHVDREIERLTSKVAQLKVDLRGAEKQLLALRSSKAPFAVGDVVEANMRGTWVKAIVREVKPFHREHFWYRVSKQKKDGDWSAQWVEVASYVRRPESHGEDR